MADVSTCARCGASPLSSADDGGCARCGAPVASDPREALRQERAVAWALGRVLDAEDVAAAARDLLEKNAARARLLAASVEPGTRGEPTVQTSIEPSIEPSIEAAPATTTTTTVQASATTVTPEATTGSAPTPTPKTTPTPPTARATRPSTTTAPRPGPTTSRRPEPPPPRPVLSPAEARARFEQRLEIGGWFTGALFAVGGSLWATNLFWSDIPATWRPVVVGAGLALFAAAFMATGSMLARRHADSLAGHVLGLVGRLIGVSATIPLAMLRQENPVLWVPTTALVVAGLWGALRFVDRRTTTTPADASTSTYRVGGYFLAGFVLAALGPTSFLAVLVAGAALLMMRAAFSAGTLAALAGARTWVDDVAVLGMGTAATASALIHGRDALGSGLHSALWSLAVVAVLEVTLRLIEQRPAFYGLRALARWALALWSVGTAVALAGGEHHVVTAAAMLFVGASFFDPGRLGLPRFFSLAGTVAVSLAAAALTRVLPLHGDDRGAVATIAGLVTLFALTGHHRRGAPDRGEQVASVLLWCVAFVVAIVVDDDRARIVTTALAASLFVTDRRVERSVPFGLVTVPAVMVPVGLFFDEALSGRADAPATVLMLALGAVVLQALRIARPARPLLAVLTAASWWTITVGVVAAFAAPDHGTGLVATACCAVALLVMQERSRQADVGVGGAALAAVVVAVLARDAGHVSLPAGFTLAAIVLAALSFVPPTTAGALRVLAPGWYRIGRARLARPWTLGIVASSLVGLLLVVRLFALAGSADLVGVSSSVGLLVAAALLWARCPSSRQLVLVLLALIVVGADVAGLLGSDGIEGHAALVPKAFGAATMALVLAVVAVIVRVRAVLAPVFLRGVRRRRPSLPVRGPVWMTALVAVTATDLVAFTVIAGSGGVDDVMWRSALLLVVVTAQAVVLFMGRAVDGLASIAVIAGALAPASLALRALLAGREEETLAYTLGVVAVAVIALVGARLLYRDRPLPLLFEAWPAPSSLRSPGLAVVLSMAGLVGMSGLAMHSSGAAGADVARRYGPGIVIVGVAIGLAGIVAWRTRRTLTVAVLGAVVLGLVGAGLDGVAHAAGWVPKSFGMSQAFVALGLVAAALLLDRDRGRALLVRLSLGWPAVVRRRLVAHLVVIVPLVGAFSCLLAVREAPRAHELAILLVGVAFVALCMVIPTTGTARVGATGVVLVGAGAAAAVARLSCGEDIALRTQTLPTIALGGLLGAVAVQAFARRLWRSSALASFHARRIDDDDGLVDRCAAAMRGTVEGQGLLVLAVVVAVAVADPNPAGLALWSTWLAMGLAVLLTSRMAIDGEQTWPAALGQGMALAIYVDIRRRTPWLDDVAGIDVIACLAAAAVFVAIGMASRRQPRGANATARAAEIYAVTLPVIAAGLGDSDAGRAVICLVGGGLYAVLSRTRKNPRYELAAGVALVAATTLALSSQGVRDATLYLLPVAFTGTFLARRHRASLGSLGRSLAVWCHVPLYAASAWSALKTETFAAFAMGVIIATIGVVYSMRTKDRRSLYAAASAAAVLVVGRLVLLGLDNALLGTLLLAGAGILLLAGMTIFTIRRDAATDAVKRAAAGLDDWE